MIRQGVALASAALLAGGVAATHEGLEKADRLAIERYCAASQVYSSPDPADESICKGIITTAENRNALKTEGLIYSLLASLSLTGALGGFTTTITMRPSATLRHPFTDPAREG